VPLRDNFDVFYIASAKVGSPARDVRLIVDTGSSDLWVGKGIYNAGRSSTADYTGRQATFLYGQGQVSGSEVTDRFCLGEVCVAEQALLVASQLQGIPNRASFDGLLGLAFPALAAIQGVPTFLQELSGSGLFRPLAFALSLSGMASPGGEASHVAFGDVEALLAERHPETGVSMPVWLVNGQTKFWLVPGAVISGDRMLPFVGALDSGTSLLAMPLPALSAVLPAILPPSEQKKCAPSTTGGVLCPCSVRLTPLRLRFVGEGGKVMEVVLTSEDLLQYVGDYNSYWGPWGSSKRLCRLNLQPAPPTLQFFILGDVFLRRVYTVHDVAGKRIVLFPQGKTHGEQAAQANLSSAEEAVLKQLVQWTPVLQFAAAAGAGAAVVGAVLSGAFLLRRRRAAAPAADSYSRL